MFWQHNINDNDDNNLIESHVTFRLSFSLSFYLCVNELLFFCFFHNDENICADNCMLRVSHVHCLMRVFAVLWFNFSFKNACKSGKWKWIIQFSIQNSLELWLIITACNFEQQLFDSEHYPLFSPNLLDQTIVHSMGRTLSFKDSTACNGVIGGDGEKKSRQRLSK